MFTGIVEELGEVVRLTETEPDSALLAVRGPVVTSDARHGDSIAVNGVCLTVVEVTGDVFTADVMGETLRRSSLGVLRPGDPVNLERAATLGSRLGGHLVQGHVDGVGEIIGREPLKQWEVGRQRAQRSGARGQAAGTASETVRFALPAPLTRYVVEKGSITIDGVSLTVVEVGEDWFSVGLIPTTLELTTLGRKGLGDPVNLEVDVIAKYVEKMIGAR